jgi:hypothetical protein
VRICSSPVRLSYRMYSTALHDGAHTSTLLVVMALVVDRRLLGLRRDGEEHELLLPSLWLWPTTSSLMRRHRTMDPVDPLSTALRWRAVQPFASSS